jgi:polar amino acid transport system substrate-binding protein
MKTIFWAALAAVALLLPPDRVHAQTIVVSTLEDKDPVTAMAEKVMAEAYRRLGMSMEVREFPGERALQTANEGKVDGELYRKGDISDTYTHLIKIPVLVSSADFMVFTMDKNIRAHDWISLLPYRVGYKRGVKSVEVNLVKGTKAEPVSSTDQAFKKLETGRNDVVISPRITGLVLLSQLGIQGVTLLEPPLLSIQLFHYLHEKNRALVPQLTSTLQQMEKEGVIRNIHKQVEQAALSQSK